MQHSGGSITRGVSVRPRDVFFCTNFTFVQKYAKGVFVVSPPLLALKKETCGCDIIFMLIAKRGWGRKVYLHTLLTRNWETAKTKPTSAKEANMQKNKKPHSIDMPPHPPFCKPVLNARAWSLQTSSSTSRKTPDTSASCSAVTTQNVIHRL